MHEHCFSSGPEVCVELQYNKGVLSRIALKSARRFVCRTAGSERADDAIAWLEAYSRKKPITARHLLNLSALPPFHQEVLSYLQSVPFGETQSYGDVAQAVGNPRAARAVGSACNRNPFPLLIPCHRVIAANGTLGGFAIDMRIKGALLEFEGNS